MADAFNWLRQNDKVVCSSDSPSIVSAYNRASQHPGDMKHKAVAMTIALDWMCNIHISPKDLDDESVASFRVSGCTTVAWSKASSIGRKPLNDWYDWLEKEPRQWHKAWIGSAIVRQMSMTPTF
jgi:hypothetical protein